MKKSINFLVILIVVALLVPMGGYVHASTPQALEPTEPNSGFPIEANILDLVSDTPGTPEDWSSAAQESIRLSEYRISWHETTAVPGLDAAYQASNRAQNIRSFFTSEGIKIVPRQLNEMQFPWNLELSLVGYGYSSDVQPVGGAKIKADGNRIYYQRDGLTEWYINNESGLEQGFTLYQPPKTSLKDALKEISLELLISSDLEPSMSADRAFIEFFAGSQMGSRVGVLSYEKLSVTDTTGRQLAAELNLIQVAQTQLIQIKFDDTGAQYPITIDPLLGRLGWTAEGDQVGSSFGHSVSTAGDVNGDGYDDAIVGAIRYDNGQADEGRVFVFHGSAEGLSTIPNWTAEGDLEYTWFGYSVGTAGDVNGDGYDDVIVGTAWYYDNDQYQEGRAFVYFGSALGLSTIPNWTAQSNVIDDNFGFSVSTAGDVNGDGYDDVIVGAIHYDKAKGRAYVYNGSAEGLSAIPDWTAEGDQDAAQFGSSVNTAGDVNGDGYDDVIIGAPGYSNDQVQEGRAYIYLGSEVGLSIVPAWTAESNHDDAYFGFSVSTAGEVNGDGYDDVIIGAPFYTDNDHVQEGRAFVYLGSAVGLSTDHAWTADNDQTGAQFGLSVSTGGDMNGDGFGDVIVGAPNHHSDEGRAYVFFGSEVGLSGVPDWTADCDQWGAYYGLAVSTAGDVDGDGYDDIIVGAPYYSNGQAEEGRAFVYINNNSPIANAGYDQSVTTFSSVTLDGSSSNDLDGDLPLTYVWVQIGGTTVTLNDPAVVNPSFAAPGDPSVLSFSLMVTDSLGLSDPTPDTVVITVNNQAPSGDAGSDQIVNTISQVTLPGSGIDPDGDLPLSFHWIQTGGTPVTLSNNASRTPIFTSPSDPTILTFTLEVIDSLGLADPTPDSAVITVINQAPLASAGPDQNVDTLALVTLTGYGTDPDGDLPLTYFWIQTGGTIIEFSDPALANPSFSAPANPTVLTFSLYVTDNLGMISVSDEVTIIVGQPHKVFLPLVLR